MSFDDLRNVTPAVEQNGEIHADDSELLARLNGAATVADGVEARLDDILGTLDDLLTSLQSGDNDKATIPQSEEHAMSTK